MGRSREGLMELQLSGDLAVWSSPRTWRTMGMEKCTLSNALLVRLLGRGKDNTREIIFMANAACLGREMPKALCLTSIFLTIVLVQQVL